MLSGLESHGSQMTCFGYVQGNNHQKDSEIKHGHLCMLQKFDKKSFRIPVRMSVYKNSYGHYAIVNADKIFTNKSVYLNLKNSTVLEKSACELTIVTNNADGMAITFLTKDIQETKDWKVILQAENVNSSLLQNKLSTPAIAIDGTKKNNSTTSEDAKNQGPLIPSHRKVQRVHSGPRSPLPSVTEMMEDEE